MTVQTLIDKAAGKVGSKYKLAQMLEVSPNRVNDWAKGRQPCSPADRARIASFAGEDAAQELIRATLEATEGTTRGDQLRAALGKLLLQTGEGLHIALAGIITASVSLMIFDLPRCIHRSK